MSCADLRLGAGYFQTFVLGHLQNVDSIFRRTAVICDTTLLLTADREQISVLSQQLHFGSEVVVCLIFFKPDVDQK